MIVVVVVELFSYFKAEPLVKKKLVWLGFFKRCKMFFFLRSRKEIIVKKLKLLLTNLVNHKSHQIALANNSKPKKTFNNDFVRRHNNRNILFYLVGKN